MSHASVAANLTRRQPSGRQSQGSERAAESDQDRYYDQVMAEAREIVMSSLGARRRHLSKRRHWFLSGR